MATSPLLELEDVSVTYRLRRTAPPVAALDHVTLTVPAGQALGIVGESGSGKSSLAHAVVGLVPTNTGRIRFQGRDITQLSQRARRGLSQRLQFVFQDPYSSLDPKQTIGSIVAETLSTQRGISNADLHRFVVDSLERVGIDKSVVNYYPRQLSGGQRQRVAIARALLPGPQLVICDEVVSALDLSVQAQVLNLLIQLRSELGLTYLFITHDLTVARHLCDHLIVLRNGRIVESGTVDQIFDHPTTRYTQALLTATPTPDPHEQRRRRQRRQEAAQLEGAHATQSIPISTSSRLPEE